MGEEIERVRKCWKSVLDKREETKAGNTWEIMCKRLEEHTTGKKLFRDGRKLVFAGNGRIGSDSCSNITKMIDNCVE